MENEQKVISVIGLGYVGLPLAAEFGKYRPVIGFDVDSGRVEQLRYGYDRTREVSSEELADSSYLSFTDKASDLESASIYIVTVPTPIDASKRPDMSPLLKASETVGTVLSKGDIVIYESTVYPGATEEVCVPVLEKISGLKFNQDFYCGYSPERINPGDKSHRLSNICKVTSGSTPDIAIEIDDLYAEIISAGTHSAPSIRVAEAAKVIENTQRDLNIALINELAIIFNKLSIDTNAVLAAAGTKWNFLPFRPGLVGGHCIGVDPYYLTHKAEEIGYHPQIILAGRRLNDGMGSYVADQIVKEMISRRMHVNGSRILVLGLAFKEDCPDLRNTRVVDVIRELQNYGVIVDVQDPMVDAGEALDEYGIELINQYMPGLYDGIILAVPHQEYRNLKIEEIRSAGKQGHVFYDLKCAFPSEKDSLRL